MSDDFAGLVVRIQTAHNMQVRGLVQVRSARQPAQSAVTGRQPAAARRVPAARPRAPARAHPRARHPRARARARHARTRARLRAAIGTRLQRPREERYASQNM